MERRFEHRNSNGMPLNMFYADWMECRDGFVHFLVGQTLVAVLRLNDGDCVACCTPSVVEESSRSAE